MGETAAEQSLYGAPVPTSRNAETERMIRTIKEEVIWLEEFASFTEAKEKIGPWIEQDYNRLYPHSALGYRSPVEFEEMVAYQAKAA